MAHEEIRREARVGRRRHGRPAGGRLALQRSHNPSLLDQLPRAAALRSVILPSTHTQVTLYANAEQVDGRKTKSSCRLVSKAVVRVPKPVSNVWMTAIFLASTT